MGPINDRAISGASAAANSTAIKPTRIELLRMAAAGAMKAAFGANSMTAIHWPPARTRGAKATPSGCPSLSRTTRETPREVPRNAAKSGQSFCQSVGTPFCQPNSRDRSGWTR
jgi:hypothetical protein